MFQDGDLLFAGRCDLDNIQLYTALFCNAGDVRQCADGLFVDLEEDHQVVNAHLTSKGVTDDLVQRVCNGETQLLQTVSAVVEITAECIQPDNPVLVSYGTLQGTNASGYWADINLTTLTEVGTTFRRSEYVDSTLRAHVLHTTSAIWAFPLHLYHHPTCHTTVVSFRCTSDNIYTDLKGFYQEGTRVLPKLVAYDDDGLCIYSNIGQHSATHVCANTLRSQIFAFYAVHECIWNRCQTAAGETAAGRYAGLLSWQHS